MFDTRQIETHLAMYNQEISGRKIILIGGDCQALSMDQYAQYSYTINQCPTTEFKPSVVLQNRWQLPGYCYSRASIAADVF